MSELLTQKEIDTIILVGLQLLGMLAIMMTFFVIVFSKYQDWEQSITLGIADYAKELYDYFDKMFKRKSLNYCYGLIIGATLGMMGLGFLVGLNFNITAAFIGMAFLGFMGFNLPRIVVRGMFNARVSKFDEQIVDALNMMANALKSGLSFMQVIQLLERELDNPASEEFAMCLKENQVGVGLNDALLNMSKRMPSQDLFMIVNSVVTLQEKGGELSEAFETIAETIRERQRVGQKIKTMATQGVFQGIVLCSLPFVMMVLFYFMQPDYMMLLFTTTLGQGLLVAMFILMGLGALWIKQILTIDI